MRQNESSENLWMILNKKEWLTLQLQIQLRWTLINLKNKQTGTSWSTKFCSWGASVKPGNRPVEQTWGSHWLPSWIWAKSLLSLQTGKIKRSAIKGNSMLVRLQLKYCVLFQAPPGRKGIWEPGKSHQNGLEPWGWCLRSRWWSLVCLVWPRGTLQVT